MTTAAIITADKFDPSALLYDAELQERGIKVMWFEPNNVINDLQIDDGQPVLHEDSSLRAVDAIVDVGSFPGDMAAMFYLATEHAGIVQYNDSPGVATSSNKWLTHRAAVNAGLPVARSVLVSEQRFLHSEARALGFPLVVKSLYGSQGRQVLLAMDDVELEAAANELQLGQLPLMLQHYIECSARDKRIIVIDGEVVDCHERVAVNDSFRSNVSLGGLASRVAAQSDEAALAIDAAKLVGLTVAGMDIARVSKVLPGREYLQQGTPFWIEANKSPGFRPGDYSPPRVIDVLLSRIAVRAEVLEQAP